MDAFASTFLVHRKLFEMQWATNRNCEKILSGHSHRRCLFFGKIKQKIEMHGLKLRYSVLGFFIENRKKWVYHIKCCFVKVRSYIFLSRLRGE